MASPDSLRQIIQMLPMAIAEHTDPQAKADLTQCMHIMMKIQAKDHATANQGQNAAQAITQRLGGQPPMPPQGENPVATILQHLGGQ